LFLCGGLLFGKRFSENCPEKAIVGGLPNFVQCYKKSVLFHNLRRLLGWKNLVFFYIILCRLVLFADLCEMPLDRCGVIKCVEKPRKWGLTSFSSHGTIGMEEENPIGKTFPTL
jgi:hypothetical protein